MGLVEHTPLLVRQINGVLQALEDEVAGLGTIALGPERRERQGVGRVVYEVEAAFEA